MTFAAKENDFHSKKWLSQQKMTFTAKNDFHNKSDFLTKMITLTTKVTFSTQLSFPRSPISRSTWSASCSAGQSWPICSDRSAQILLQKIII
jgi:hypothetical protein